MIEPLSDEQRAVVLAPQGPVLVLAGAGSGKTRALVHRVAHLLQGGAAPGRILLMTFTTAAAREMIGRIGGLLGPGGGAQDLWAGTFHHTALRILRCHGRRLGLPDGFSVLDRHDAEELFAACLSVGRLPARLALRLSSLSLGREEALATTVSREAPAHLDAVPALRRGLDEYARRKLQIGALDFDDLLLLLRLLLVDHPDVAATVSEHFQHLLVDEYQDTSPLEAALVDQLAQASRSLLVVGDDAQAIYRFRGGDVGAILGFQGRWPEAVLMRLSTNYRSSAAIIAVANASIGKNHRQYAKQMRVARGSLAEALPRPAIVPLASDAAEAAFVAARIFDLIQAGRRPGDLAILYRAHGHAEAVQRELSRCKTPFHMRSGTPLLSQAHVKDVLAHLRLVTSPRDEVALRRVLRLWIGARPTERLLSPDLADREPFLLLRAAADAVLPPAARASLGALLGLLTALATAAAGPICLAELVEQVLAAYYEAYAQRTFLDAAARLAALRRLAAPLRGPLDDLLTELSLGGAWGEEADGGSVTLSTVHRAKGLEWPVVFVIALAEGRFPVLASPGSTADALEEERRLFYVAVTRARDELYLCCSQSRASRFVRELDGQLFQRWHVTE